MRWSIRGLRQMQMHVNVRNKVSLLGKARRRFLGLSPTETSFAKRGFLSSEEQARRRLEEIGITFLSGYHAALEETAFVPLARRLSTIDAEIRGFAFEGTAMALALLDCFTPWRKDRWQTFTERSAAPHVYMMHVGLGWALARLRRSVTSHLAQLDPLLGWLVVDGYGFHEGYFYWRRYVEAQALPARLNGYERRVFDQGLGRSMWFVKGADVAAVAKAINAFPPGRRDDLWSGVGLACAYAGGCGRAAMQGLRAAAHGHLPALAQGVAFAAKTRQRAANLTPHTETACHLICGHSAKGAAAITDAALEELHADGELPAYEIWRRRIQNKLALGVTRR
jgi:enediyne biosynthesis protein E3